MPHVSKYKLDKTAESRLFKTLELVLTRITKEEDLNDFLLALLTPTEQIMLAKRLGIIVLLKEGLPESRIASALHVTRITVSRMQLFLEARGKGYELAIEILKKEQVMDDLKILLLKLAGYAARAAGGRVKPSIL